jgi:pimeloyl-ACP methyl ester carboxylesterase
MLKVLVFLTMLLFSVVHASVEKDIEYISSADGSMQPTMLYVPETNDPVPLVVLLHTWSGDYKQTDHDWIKLWSIRQGWAYIHPHFRGPNNRPEATGSELVIKDILSAIDHVVTSGKIDESSIYLVGTSGGGYTALLMAGRHPERWAGVSAWVPISDLKAWYEQGRYISDLINSCGGAPDDSPAVDREYANRSPITYLKHARGVNIHISAGINDGHQGSVPISHSINAFNELADPIDRIATNDVTHFVSHAQVPPNLRGEFNDASYGDSKLLFRRKSGTAILTIFDGGHELVAPASVEWIQSIQVRKERHYQ